MSSDTGEVSLAQRGLCNFLAPGNTKEVSAIVWQNIGLRQDICNNPLTFFSIPSCTNLSKRSKINRWKGSANQQSNIQRYFQESCQSYVHISNQNNFKKFLAPKYSDINLLDYHSIFFIPIPSATWWKKYPYDVQSNTCCQSWSPVPKHEAPRTRPVPVFFHFTVCLGILRYSKGLKSEKLSF